MNEDFAPFELAVKLKEKGFKWICSHYYRTKCKDLFMVFPIEDWSDVEDRVNAPTISQVLKWLREGKGMEVYPIYNRVYKHWTYIARAFDDSCYNSVGGFKSYEQAAIAGIEYVLDNLI